MKSKKTTSTNGHGPSLEGGEDTPESRRAADPRTVLDRESEREQVEIIEQMRNAGGAGAYLRIERRKPNEQDWALIVPRAPLENYNDVTKLEEYLLGTFGGGDYKIQARTSRGAVVKAFPLKIDHSIPAKMPGEAKAEPKSMDPGTIVRDIVSQLIPLLKSPAAPPQDNAVLVAMINSQTQMAIESAKAQAQLTTTIFSTMGTMGKRESDPQLTAILGKMERAIERMGDSSSPKQKSGAEEILALLEVIERIRDNSPDDTSKGMLAQFGEAIAPIAKALLAGGVGAIPARSVLDPSADVRQAPPAPLDARPGAPAAAAEATTTTTTTADDDQNAMNFFVKQALAQVSKEALTVADRAAVLEPDAKKQMAEDFAAELSRKIPEAYDAQVIAALSDPDWLSKFFGLDPRVQTHAIWLGIVRDCVLEELTEA